MAAMLADHRIEVMAAALLRRIIMIMQSSEEVPCHARNAHVDEAALCLFNYCVLYQVRTG